MATVDLFTNHGFPAEIGTPCFAVDQDVGPIQFGSYKPTDVQLVQVLLQIIATNTPSMNRVVPKPEKPIQVDRGLFGPVTKAWVEWFQLSTGLVHDGQVSHAPKGRSVGTKSGLVYTILFLNVFAAKADRGRHFRIMTDPSVPKSLRDDLNRGRK